MIKKKSCPLLATAHIYWWHFCSWISCAQSSSTRVFSLWGFDCCSLLKPKIFEIINPGTFVSLHRCLVRSLFWLLPSRTLWGLSFLCCLGSVFRVFVLLEYVSCNFVKPYQSLVKCWQDWIRKDGGQTTKYLHLSALNKAYYQHLVVVCLSSEHHFYINITLQCLKNK